MTKRDPISGYLWATLFVLVVLCVAGHVVYAVKFRQIRGWMGPIEVEISDEDGSAGEFEVPVKSNFVLCAGGAVVDGWSIRRGDERIGDSTSIQPIQDIEPYKSRLVEPGEIDECWGSLRLAEGIVYALRVEFPGSAEERAERGGVFYVAWDWRAAGGAGMGAAMIAVAPTLLLLVGGVPILSFLGIRAGIRRWTQRRESA